jgi:uncharacterized surface protein with fasciclin (FAS1) repeats
MLFSIIKKAAITISTVAILASAFVIPSLSTSAAGASNNIVETAISAPNFSTLVTAVKAAGLVETLSGTGPFTVLAPTNEAFAKIPAESLVKLLLPENKDRLVKLLTYHVITGSVDSSQIVKLEDSAAQTVQGDWIGVEVKDGKVVLNTDTTVLVTDIQTSNGIIHAIDSVLLPDDVDFSDIFPEDSSDHYSHDDQEYKYHDYDYSHDEIVDDHMHDHSSYHHDM